MAEVKEVKPISMKALIVGAIFVILVSMFMTINYNVTTSWPEWYGTTYGRAPTGSPYIAGWSKFIMGMCLGSLLLFVVTLINMVRPVFKKTEVTVVWLMIFLTAFMSSLEWGNAYSQTPSFFFTYGWGYWSPTRCPPEEDAAKITMYMADIMGCGKDKEYWQMVMSTWWSPMRWDYAMPMIIWGGTLLFVLSMLGVFLALIFRRLYVDVEALTFPIASIANDMIETSQRTEEGKIGFTSNKWFVIGFLIQFVWLFIVNIPWDIWNYVAYGEQAPWGTGRGRFGDIHIYPVYDATQLAILPWVTLNIFLEPWLIGWGAIFPTDVLIGALVGWFIFLVILPVAWTAAGLWEPMPVGTFGYIIERINGHSVPTGGTPNIMWIVFGMIATFTVLPIIRNWGTMGPILMAITGKEPPEDIDPDKPVPYKIALWGLIASIILYVALATVANVIPLWSLVWLLFTTFMMIGSIRIVAEAGGYLGQGFMHPFPGPSWPEDITGILLVTLNPICPIVGVEPTRATMMTYTFTSYGLGHGLFTYTPHCAAYGTLESFRLAKYAGIRLKDVVIIAAITFLLAMFTHGFGTFFWNFVFPTDKFIGALFPWLGAGLFFNIYQKNISTGVPYWPDRARVLNLTEVPGPTDAVIKLIIGIAIVVGLTLARERFPWLRISAAGIAVGMMFGHKFWLPFIIALLIKYIALRVGGVRLYEERVRPMMIGFLYGFFLIEIINILTGLPATIRGQYGLI